MFLTLLSILFTRRNLEFLAVAIILIAAVIFGKYHWGNVQETAAYESRMEQNIKALQGEVKQLKTQSGKQMLQTPAQSYTAEELKILRSDILASLKDMKIKPNRAQSISNIGTTTEKQIITLVRDSLTIDSIKLKVFSYEDPWFCLQSVMRGDTAVTSYKSSDSITQAVYWSRKWFLGRKRYEQKITNRNPNSKINYAEFIEVKRKK